MGPPVRVYRIQGKEYVFPFVACEYLGCTAEMLKLYISQGRLTVIRVGQRDFVELDRIEAMLLERQEGERAISKRRPLLKRRLARR